MNGLKGCVARLGAAQAPFEDGSSWPKVHAHDGAEGPEACPALTVINGRIEWPPFVSACHDRFLVLGRTRFPRAEAGKGVVLQLQTLVW